MLGVTPREASERGARGQAPLGLGGGGGLVVGIVTAAVSGDCCLAIGSHGTMSQATLIGKLGPPTWLLQPRVLGHRERLHQVGHRQTRELDLELLMGLKVSEDETDADRRVSRQRTLPH